MFKGAFSASLFFKVVAIVIAVTIVIIYQISQYYQHQKPFPHCWISKVAQHYPEFVLFRIATISGAVFIILGWFTNLFYLKSIAHENSFDIRKYHPEIGTIIGVMGGLILMGNTATIDTGKMNSHWHTTCATQFFYFTLVAQMYNTLIYGLIYSKIKTINKYNLYLKYILTALIIYQLYLSFFKTNQFIQGNVEIEGDLGKFLEWTITATVLLGYYSIGVDCSNFEYVLMSVK